jgi:hypothetical protein
MRSKKSEAGRSVVFLVFLVFIGQSHLSAIFYRILMTFALHCAYVQLVPRLHLHIS